MTDLNALAERLDAWAEVSDRRGHTVQAEDTRQAAQALRGMGENLATRDDFIVSRGLWMDFVESLPPARSALKGRDGADD